MAHSALEWEDLKEALDVTAGHKAALTRAKLSEVNQRLKEGRENLAVVRVGHGVYNTKYAIVLLI